MGVLSFDFNTRNTHIYVSIIRINHTAGRMRRDNIDFFFFCSINIRVLDLSTCKKKPLDGGVQGVSFIIRFMGTNYIALLQISQLSSSEGQ